MLSYAKVVFRVWTSKLSIDHPPWVLICWNHCYLYRYGGLRISQQLDMIGMVEVYQTTKNLP
jgi:hypothetical protein